MGEAPQRMAVSQSPSPSAAQHAAGSNKQHGDGLLEERSPDGSSSNNSNNSNNNNITLEQSPTATTTEDDSTETVSHESDTTTASSARTATTANTDHYSSSATSNYDDDDEHHHAHHDAEDAHDHHQEQQLQQEQQEQQEYDNDDELGGVATTTAVSAFQTAVEWKVEGNAAFSNKNFQQALEAYQRGLEAMAAAVVMMHREHAAVSRDDDNDSSTSTSASSNFRQQIQELKIILYANCAMALIRLHQFQQAEQVCTDLLQQQDDCNHASSAKDLTRTKIWYRRALARQGRALTLLAPSSSSTITSTTPVKNASNEIEAAARDLLLAAKSDLRQAMALVDEFADPSVSTCSTTTAKERDALKKTVITLAQQVQSHLQQLLLEKEDDDSSSAEHKQPQQQTTIQNNDAARCSIITASTTNGIISTASSSTSNSVVGVTPLKNSIPDPAKQRHDIIRLLLARQVELQQQQQANTAAAALPGEGFFLVDAHWWTQFCHFVDLFYAQSNSNGNSMNGKNGTGGSPVAAATTITNLSPIQTKLLGYLPPGAILPVSYDTGDKNEASSSDSDDDGDDDDHMVRNHEAPGPIDNTRLLLLPPRQPLAVGAEEGNGALKRKAASTCKTRQIFLRHWYRRCDPLLNTMSPLASTSASSSFSNNDNATTNEGAQEQQQLCPSLVRGYHYEILPREVYSALVQWYGEVTPSLCRRATVLNNTSSAAVVEGDEDARIAVPLYPNACSNNIAQSSLHQPNNDNHEVLLPPPQPSCGSCRAPRVVLRCTRCSVVYYCDRTCQSTHWPWHKNECKRIQQYKQQVVEQQQQQQQQQQLDSSSSKIQLLPAKLLPIADGRVGLNNLGNTCFMNSALQCLSHSTPLTRLFLSGNFRLDVNQSNPLGSGGKLAHAYEAVMKDLWMRDEFGAKSAAMRRRKSTSPTALKRAIALFAPRFAGHLQHDAQEFLAYLLDGLHEDLNRIRQAPYVEMPDVTDGQNMHVAGARAWDAHRRRNDSLVMDTFYGQFKSTCVCPRCNRVSVSFDAFNHVSLEIPQQHAIVSVGVVVCRAPTGSSNAAMMKPARYSVQMRRDSPISDLKQEVSKLCGIPVSHLQLCDVMEQEIISIYRDNQLVSNIKNLTVAYEAEPFSNAAFASFHVIAKHKLVTTSLAAAIAAAEEYKDEAALAAAVASSDNDFMGIPVLTSFPADSTCRQVFQHFWELVQDKLPDGEMEHCEDILQLRMHNGQGQPVALFPSLAATADATSAAHSDAEEAKEEEQLEKSGRASLIPKDLDEPLVRFLGEAAIDTFLSVWIEWNDTICESNDCNVDVDRFSLVNNHSSWVEAEERLRTTRGVTLDQCFETFTKPERLDERNMWYCSKCKEHVRAMKTMELWRLPNIMIVHLKRFEFKNILRRDKLDTFVHFPLEGLDMSNHCASDRDISFVEQTVPAVYDLFAVTNHYGRMGFGHYTAFAREWSEDGLSDDWALFDDSAVRSVGDGTDSVVSPAAYVLFYRRRTFS